MDHPNFFWLHIKKSAGISTRRLLQPHYVEVDRVNKPKTFIQAEPAEYNDILNNYRVVLGEYQFKRCLFAKTFLYGERWENLFSFAFSREPVDRCLSMFHYLYWTDFRLTKRITRILKHPIRDRKLYNKAFAFDAFLDFVYQARISDSIYTPFNLHFTTHTAPMWDDITDWNGKILISAVFRVEHLQRGIDRVFEKCGIEKRPENTKIHINKNKNRTAYTPTVKQRKKIEEIYENDFHLYENAER